MAIAKNIRRGRTWQDGDWRVMLTATGGDLADRARMAFAKVRQAKQIEPASIAEQHGHELARLVAPFTGDGVPAGGPFIIRPAYSTFA
jgi:DNA-binding transcriptional LysR family regulator